jgi:hypothetical protein
VAFFISEMTIHMKSDIILSDALSARQPQPRQSEISRFWQRAESYERENIEAAQIILRDVDRHGGETAGLVIWARLTLAHASERRAA